MLPEVALFECLGRAGAGSIGSPRSLGEPLDARDVHRDAIRRAVPGARSCEIGTVVLLDVVLGRESLGPLGEVRAGLRAQLG